MSNTLTEMDKIVNLLKEKGGMSEEHIKQNIEQLRKEEELRIKLSRPKEDPRLVFNNHAATIIFPNGFSVAIDRIGNMQWTYDDKKIDESTSTPIVNQHEMELCLKHIINLHMVEKFELARDLMKMSHESKEEVKVKHRYTSKDKKRAFVSGMILGKKEANG